MLLRKRKPIQIKGEDANVFEITEKKHPLKGFIRRETRRFRVRESVYKRYNLGQTLANVLFPESFVRMIATDHAPEKSGKGSEITYSERVKLDRKSQEGIEAAYLDTNWSRKKVAEHFDRVTRSNLKEEIFEQAGIDVNTHPVNVGFRGFLRKKPIFFEVRSINVQLAEEYVKKLKDKEKREIALALLESLKKEIPKEEWDKFVEVHI